MKEGNCIHWTGVQKEVCNKGVNYRELIGNEDNGWALRLPCWQCTMKHAQDVVKVSCDQYQGVTKAMEKEDESETKEYMRKFTTLVLPIIRKFRGTGKPHVYKSEIVECPFCQGKLQLSQSAYNGHVHGRCDTPNCIHYME